MRGRSGGWGAVGTAAIEWPPAGPEACGPDPGPEPTTTGPGCGSATTGVRVGGALSSVALPATTTIIVGTEVSSTSSAEISSGRRLGENSRWLRTSEDNGTPNSVGSFGLTRRNAEKICPTWGDFSVLARR
ncbi:hypothetical protein ACQP1P_00530 [Dactylosporangium sp. CA-052675]|uniref:hypothetical protein n=1 Tax=Dactylosporangium sp. CA-052675 TaxID=3239927 RepID=UPI003D8E0B31